MAAFQLNARENTIDIDAVNQDFLKELISDLIGRKSFWEQLKQLKTIAEDLGKEGLTITFSIEGDRVLLMGRNAKPKLSNVVTGTNTIEIGNLRKLMKILL